jgi:hypothetical protein
MASDPLALVRSQLSRRIAAIQEDAPRLSPLDLHAKMEAIREVAAAHGMAALEGLARCSAQRALLPGHRVAMRSCFEHVGEALDSRSAGDCTAILAAVAVRLH